MTHVTRLPALASLKQLGFRFANGEMIFESLDLSFDLTPTAIVGRNGIGKSVLAQLIAGHLKPTSGTLNVHGKVAYVAQAFPSKEGQTVADAIGCTTTLQALARLNSGQASAEDLETLTDRWDLPERLRHLLDEAGLRQIEPEHLTQSLSGGQQARIALVGAFLTPLELLVLDEPTNHLDTEGRRWLMRQLEQWRGGLIVISHDRQLLNGIQRIVELTSLGSRVFGGNYAAFQVQRTIDQGAVQVRLDQAKTERNRERIRLQREHDKIQRRAAGTFKKAGVANVSRFERAAMKGAATQIMGTVRKAHQIRKSTLDAQVRDADAKVQPADGVVMHLPGTAVPRTRQVLTLIDVQLPWRPQEACATRLTLSLTGPVRVAVRGPNGCGKSTLLRMLAGEYPPQSGECITHLPSAFLDQQLALLDDQRSIVEQLGLLDTPLSESELRGHLAQLQLDASRVTQPSGLLSGGERLKAAIALALWRKTPTQLLLLDEPTNHLDLESVEAFEHALKDFPGAIIAASHDQAFLTALAPTHTLEWQPTGWHLQTVYD
ncbi:MULTISPECIES: ABC-F family ATP-binding cassette domain-containing protein [unclassified Pseudomonas]|uniref:ABC-F family ATP-binding cassette domain-containing protein n=1 Tax=unclassified Pseudomonas TaxID=196821 RepID=UPI002AC96F64|nr:MULTISPECIES: ABC-F family ATP-binding cassette domain-containing protein [unclassified Pseudomonas]MEB0045189.1 ABC-F family ATP-binding cassette domain-containing protein [Pseudomonas sp. Dout3]MEB0096455.1 ABC-F family ATP-binding cassette domain-containing protein [Pseudomonas sp. DC1.2]WPX61407.1 ABC-F family ATP-binding cassette domain-containing protein [Pseudomonas sp. DC1.2]